MTSLKKYKINHSFILVALFALCFGVEFWFPGDIFRLGKIRALFLIIPFVLFLQIKNKLHWAPALLFCSGLFHWTVSSRFLSDFPIVLQLPPSKTIMQWTINNYILRGVEELIIPFACMSFVIFLYNYPKQFIAKIFVYFAAAQSIYGLFQVFNIQLLYAVSEPWFQNTPLAFMGQHTVLGSFLAACLAPALWFSMWAPAGLIAVCIAFTGSSMAYASTWVVLSLYVAYKFRIRHAVFMQIKLLVILTVLLLFRPNIEIFNFHERWDVWSMGIKAFLENPWFGGGAGYWPGYWQPRFFPTIGGHTPDNPHAEWLKLLIEYGIWGALIVTIACVEFLRKFKLTWHHAACAAILVNSLANFPLHIVPHAVLFLWCLGYSIGNQK